MVTLVPQTPYSPDLNLCDRWLFKELKSKLKQCHLQSASDVQTHTKHLFHQIPLERFKSEMHTLKEHCSALLLVTVIMLLSDVGGYSCVLHN